MSNNPVLSIVTTTDPVAGHLPGLLDALSGLSFQLREAVEVVIVDDLRQWEKNPPPNQDDYPDLNIQAIPCKIQEGQINAIMKGISSAKGQLIMTIDPDLHPCVTEIPDMMKLIDDNIWIVHAIRKNRQDASMYRIAGSKLANYCVSRISRLGIQDIGSPITLFKASVINLDTIQTPKQEINPRLLCYSRYRKHLTVYRLQKGGINKTKSHYSPYRIIMLALKLVADALKVRSLQEK